VKGSLKGENDGFGGTGNGPIDPKGRGGESRGGGKTFTKVKKDGPGKSANLGFYRGTRFMKKPWGRWLTQIVNS